MIPESIALVVVMGGLGSCIIIAQVIDAVINKK